MLPSILAQQVIKGLDEYLETTFPMTNKAFQGTIKTFVESREFGFAPDSQQKKPGFSYPPYVTVKLPFRASEHGLEELGFRYLSQPFKPHLHQEKAFKRLLGDEPQSSLIATGTGSGKTECFTLPILEYCAGRRQLHEKGIKAIIIYPMNALANDQAGRIMEIINANPGLAGLRVGMYVGGLSADETKGAAPAAEAFEQVRLITNRTQMQENPPDILLTNYKMLDYLLIRPKDAAIWQANGAETLKFIAVDELHTFDGAQGTDLACLVRRLKKRLRTPEHYLCCIGTSATMGSKEDTDAILDYAEDIFGEPFGIAGKQRGEAIITEDRITAVEFIAGYEGDNYAFPSEADLDELAHAGVEAEPLAYLHMAAKAWLGEAYDDSDFAEHSGRTLLGENLCSHAFFRQLISCVGTGYHLLPEMVARLAPTFKFLVSYGEDRAETAICAMLALISYARKGTRPFLEVRVQVWMRELTRMLANVDKEHIEYRLDGELNTEQQKQFLPVVNCRDCGMTGWTGLISVNGTLQIGDLNDFYTKYFDGHKDVRLVFPLEDNEEKGAGERVYFCPECLHVQQPGNGDNHCQQCGSDNTYVVSLVTPQAASKGYMHSKQQFECPFCGSRNGLYIMGMRNATEIGAGLSVLYGSKFNDDKKLLTFSDSVQDAALRAGFFMSRAERSVLRMAAQKYAQTAFSANQNPNLPEFQQAFTQYWRNVSLHKEPKGGLEYYASLFTPVNLTWQQAYKTMLAEGKLPKDNFAENFLENVRLRSEYELQLEYGLRSQTGRTLEKAGCSMLEVPVAEMETALSVCTKHLKEEIGDMPAISREELARLMLGLLRHLRVNGAIDAEWVYSEFFSKNANDYMLSADRKAWLPSSSLVPHFLCSSSKYERNIDGLRVKGWYLGWVRGYLDADELLREDLSREAILIILDELVKAKALVKRKLGRGDTVWGLNPYACHIVRPTHKFVCPVCGTTIMATDKEAAYWQGSHCQRLICHGKMREVDLQPDFYTHLYEQGDVQRILAAEHTGLLPRNRREDVEARFKAGSGETKPWYPNLLSCTPTLEMGIDIGSLSTVVLCSVPPSQAQYTQRIGRAGRKDGNALTLTVANAKAHDLYFYDEPKEMMDGEVRPPRIFLKATAVLARQFTAFCLDNWVRYMYVEHKSEVEHMVPDDVKSSLNNLNKAPEARNTNIFPFNFFQYVSLNLTELEENFFEMFPLKADTEEATENMEREKLKKSIRDFAEGGENNEESMQAVILKKYEGLLNTRESVRKQLKKIKKMLKDRQEEVQDTLNDEEIQGLIQDRDAYGKIVESIAGRRTFEFLSDESILPNYAFPEAGITLQAVLYQSRENVDNAEEPSRPRVSKKLNYEYQRPAASAISEFAPSNTFYAEGHRLTVDQVDIATMDVESWRFCPDCGHAEKFDQSKATTKQTSCPRCGSPDFGNVGQKAKMLMVRMVHSHMRERDAQIDDSQEVRKPKFYVRNLLVDVEEHQAGIRGYRIDSKLFSFGYDYVPEAIIREVNCGEADDAGHEMTIAGEKRVRKGFRICSHCGKVQPYAGDKRPHTAYELHTRVCPLYGQVLTSEKDIIDGMFLYREFKTEILRVIIPVTDDPIDTRKESFVAAFMMGLEEHFGNVDHLRTSVMDVKVQETNAKRQYLILYDSVPGGTGYLKELLNKEQSMLEVFSKALTKLKKCGCQYDLTRDGCYHCLYRFRQSSKIGNVSRRVAISMLEAIIAAKDKLQPVERVSDIPYNSAFDSELEAEFIAALKRQPGAQVFDTVVNTKRAYQLNLGEMKWEIEPQVQIGLKNSVPVMSRPDFMLRPVSPKAKTHMPVAVFCDGFEFHGNIVGDDTMKRMSIARKGKARVWSLCYTDIHASFSKANGAAVAEGNILNPKQFNSMKIYDKVLDAHPEMEKKLHELSSFVTLMDYLRGENAEQDFAVTAQAASLAMLGKNAKAPQKLWEATLCSLNKLIAAPEATEGRPTFADKWMPIPDDEELLVYSQIWGNLGPAAYPTVLLLLDDSDEARNNDGYKNRWELFWQWANVLQFAPDCCLFSSRGLASDIYADLCERIFPAIPTHQVSATASPADAEWARVMELVAEADYDPAIELVDKLRQAGTVLPDSIGDDITGTDGVVLGSAELAWSKRKIAYLAGYQLEGKNAFLAQGWQVFTDGEDAIIEALKA